MLQILYFAVTNKKRRIKEHYQLIQILKKITIKQLKCIYIIGVKHLNKDNLNISTASAVATPGKVYGRVVSNIEIKTIDKFESYASDPMPTTVLVLCYKYKTLDKRKKITKLFEKTGLVFEGKKLYENQVGQWITRVLQAKKYSIEPKASAMLVEFLGTSLEKINNELEKLQIILPVGSTISANDIEENIGFSKDYNIFEVYIDIYHLVIYIILIKKSMKYVKN